MSSSAAATRQPAPWIIGPCQDLALLILTPVLILVAAFGLREIMASRTLQYGVLAFGALGHNLPGMLRAYGDRALFRRFRTRFLVAPIAFAGISILFALHGSGGLILIAYLWAIWHAIMQAYGFSRIYDARLGITSTLAARLDLLLCLAWFGGAVMFSDARLFYIQSLGVELGFAPRSTASLLLARQVVVGAIALVSLVYVGHQFARWRNGSPISWQKNLLYVSTITFWWHVQVSIPDVLLGLVLFEVFHDVQYLTIVWIFNRKRVAADPSMGGFSRFLFRRSWSMMALYIGLVLAYGGILPATSDLQTSKTAQLVLLTFVQTSALLHYYYDGFIWKISEQSTQRALGIDAQAGRADGVVTWHGIKWLLLAVPAAGMLLLETRTLDIDAARALVASTPQSAEAQWKLAVALNQANRHLDSIPALERALAINPGDPQIELDLAMAQLLAGTALVRENRIAEAEPLIRAAHTRLPDIGHREVAAARQHHEANERDEVILHLQVAAMLLRQDAPLHLDLALQLQAAGRRADALRYARHGAALLPDNARAQALVRELEK